MQFGFMPGIGRTSALFVMRRVQEYCINKERNLYIGFADTENAFDRVLRKVMKWAVMKKGLSEVIVRAVISFYHEATKKGKVGSEFLV